MAVKFCIVINISKLSGRVLLKRCCSVLLNSAGTNVCAGGLKGARKKYVVLFGARILSYIYME